MAAGFQNPFSGFQNPFQDFDLGRAFMGAPRPQPQDFMVPGPVTTPGVSVNPHSGMGFKFGDRGTYPENIKTGMRTGDLLSTSQILDKVDLLNDEFRRTKGADPKDQFEYFGDGNWGLKSDAPTYQQRSEMLDAAKYSKELERWKLIENERLKRMGSLQEMLAYMGKQSGGGRASGGGGGTAPKSGRPTNLQMASMGVADKPEDPFRKLEEFYPFLGRYRNT